MGGLARESEVDEGRKRKIRAKNLLYPDLYGEDGGKEGKEGKERLKICCNF